MTQAIDSGRVTITAEDWALRSRPAIFTTVRRFVVRKPLGALGLLFVFIVAAAGVAAPVVARYDPEQPFQSVNPDYNPDDPFSAPSPTKLAKSEPPSWKHWFGTDAAGRDTWSRVVWGARRSLSVGVLALLISTAAGTFLGVVSAFFGGWFDTLVQRLMDAIQAFPALLILLLLATLTKPTITSMVLALGFIGVTQVSRIVRGSVLAVRETPYVEAARVVGCSDWRIMALHILPNVAAPIIVVFTIGIGSVIIAEASLSFLGVAPPGISWGDTLNEGRRFVYSSPWQALFSGAAITMAVLGFNLAGDALRDVLDPRLRV